MLKDKKEIVLEKILPNEYNFEAYVQKYMLVEVGAKLPKSGKLIEFIYEDAKTQIEVIQRGCRISENGRCLGWKSSHTSYSWISYKDFMTRAMNFGSGLMKIGPDLGQSTLIGIYAQNSVEWLIAQYGCFYYSSPIVPLSDTLGSDSCSYMINNGEITTIICDTEEKVNNLLRNRKSISTLRHIICVSDLTDSVKKCAIQYGINLYLFQDIEKIGEHHQVQSRLPKSTDVAEICYTSGTTGNPKGVVLTHGNIVSAVQAAALHLGSAITNETDTLISYLPLSHMMEQFCENLIFLHGGCVGFFGGDVSLLLDDMKILQPTFFPAVPRLLNKLFEKAQDKEGQNRENGKTYQNELSKDWDPSLYRFFAESLGGKIKLILTSAAPISHSVLKFYKQVLKCNVVELYGQTETSGPCTGNVVSEASVGHVGTPVACCMVKLIDVPELEYFADNNTGELCVKGYNTFKCYHKDPERTEEIIDKDGWVHTGDIVECLPNGVFKIIDRRKHIFKLSQGEYIAPERLENIYLQSSLISQILIHGNSFQSYVVAIVVPDEQNLISGCKENLKSLKFLEACKNSDLKQLILEDMNRIAKKAQLLSFEKVKKIHLHPTPMTIEDGFLTLTLKKRRDFCIKYFEKEIQALYIENSS